MLGDITETKCPIIQGWEILVKVGISSWCLIKVWVKAHILLCCSVLQVSQISEIHYTFWVRMNARSPEKSPCRGWRRSGWSSPLVHSAGAAARRERCCQHRHLAAAAELPRDPALARPVVNRSNQNLKSLDLHFLIFLECLSWTLCFSSMFPRNSCVPIFPINANSNKSPESPATDLKARTNEAEHQVWHCEVAALNLMLDQL